MKSKRKPIRARFNSGLFDELVIDNFAGGGGASIGIEHGIGRAVDVAINHDPQAVALHKVNHPHTTHYVENVWEVDPAEVAAGRKVGLCWFSPDCKHFSRAKGGKPVEKKIRGLAWVVIRWAAKVRPRVIMLENVREFETWGPLKDNRPCPVRKGRTFKRWVSSLRGLGYEIEWRVLDAADYGAPTHRKRLFLIARRDGLPIAWPEPTHGPGRRKPWRTAAECLDWSLPCHSIFLSREEGRALGVIRPLAEKTMRRIAMGLKRFVIESPTPYIVKVNHGGPDFRGQKIGQPLSTVTGKHGFGLASPYLVPQFGEREGQAPRIHSVNQPIPTVTPRQGGGFPLVMPFLTQYNQEKGAETRGLPVDRPVNVVTPENRFGLVQAFIAKHYGGVIGHGPDRPIGTVTAIDHHSLVTAYIGQHYGDRPDGTSHAGQPAESPLPTITARATQSVVTAASLVHMNHGEKQWSTPDAPLRTVLAGANHHGLVQAFLAKYNGKSFGQGVAEPTHTVTPVERFGLVTVHGEPYQIADIGLRMLTPRELYRCQGFPEDYRIDVPFGGKSLSKAAQVRMCGNSVSPPVARALVEANFAHERIPVPVEELSA